MMDRHPYNINSPAVGAQFFGREALLSSIAQTFAASAQNAIIIFGQARTGKTSLLHQLAARLPEQGYLPVYWAFKDQANLSAQQGLQALAEAIAAKVQLPTPNLLTKRNLDYFHTQFLRQVHKKIVPQRLVLLLDDIDTPLDGQEEAGSLLYYLPQLISKAHSTAFVLSTGKKLPDLPAAWQSISPQLCYKELPFLDFQETWSLVAEGSRYTPIGYLSKGIDKIWQLSAGHPYYVQLICHDTFDYAFNKRKNQVDGALVEEALPLILEKITPDLTNLITGLSEQELKTLSACALAFAETKSLSLELIRATLEEHQLAITDEDLQQALDELKKREILYQDKEENFCFTLPLIAAWITERYPLGGVPLKKTPQVQPQQLRWSKKALIGGGLSLLLIALLGFVVFNQGTNPAVAPPAAAGAASVTAMPAASGSAGTARPTLASPTALPVTSTPLASPSASDSASFLPTLMLTPTSLPTETPVPTFTPLPTGTPVPTTAPTATATPSPTLTPLPPTEAPAPSSPTSEPASPPPPTLTLPSGSFTLLRPISLEDPTYGPTVFEWQWTGPLPADYGFEVRVWREGDVPAGIHDAVLDNENGVIENLGDNKYRLTADISNTPSVAGHRGEYLWTVALVQISPEYADLGQQALPAQLRFETPGGGGDGGGGGGGGGGPGID